MNWLSPRSLLLVLAPFLWLLQMSFKPPGEIFAFPPSLTFVPTLEHYRAIWDSAFRRSFADSFPTRSCRSSNSCSRSCRAGGIRNFRQSFGKSSSTCTE